MGITHTIDTSAATAAEPADAFQHAAVLAQQEMDSSSSPAFAVAPPRQQQCVRQADEQHQKRLQICGPAARPGVEMPNAKEGGRPGLTAANSRFIPLLQARSSSLFAPSFQPSPRQVMLNKSNYSAGGKGRTAGDGPSVVPSQGRRDKEIPGGRQHWGERRFGTESGE